MKRAIIVSTSLSMKIPMEDPPRTRLGRVVLLWLIVGLTVKKSIGGS